MRPIFFKLFKDKTQTIPANSTDHFSEKPCNRSTERERDTLSPLSNVTDVGMMWDWPKANYPCMTCSHHMPQQMLWSLERLQEGKLRPLWCSSKGDSGGCNAGGGCFKALGSLWIFEDGKAKPRKSMSQLHQVTLLLRVVILQTLSKVSASEGFSR